MKKIKKKAPAEDMAKGKVAAKEKSGGREDQKMGDKEGGKAARRKRMEGMKM